MLAKKTELMDYFSHQCLICRHTHHYVESERMMGWCFVCLGCGRSENIRAALARVYKVPLQRCNVNYRKKLLDMMARDVVREYHRRTRPTIDTQKMLKFDLVDGGIVDD